MFTLNLKIALRNLWRNKGFALINIGGLAIGLTCCLLLLLYVGYEWSYDKQFKNIDQIYVAKLNLQFNGRLATTTAVPAKLGPAMQMELPNVSKTARISMDRKTKLFSRNQNKFKLKVPYADPTFFQILDYKFVDGTAENALKEPNSIVVTETTAKKLFGDENPIGQSIKWDKQKELKVSAVIEDLPKNQSLQFDGIQPWAFHVQINPQANEEGWGPMSCN